VPGVEDGERDHRPGRERLREAAFSGVRWTIGRRAIVEVVAFGASIALARLIEPAEFGRATIALIVATLGPTLLAAIVTTDLVRRPEVDDDHLGAGAALGLGLGLALGTLAALGLPPLVAAAFDERTADLVRLSALAFPLAGLVVVPDAILQRRLDFKRISFVGLASTLAGTPLTLGLAAAGLDAYAIVIGQLAGSVVGLAGFWLAAPRTRPRWRPAAMRAILRFGAPTAAGSLAYQTYRNVDYAILGARLGLHPLGIYWRAFQLGAEYQRKLSTIISSVALPVYSRTDDLDHMRHVRRRIVRSQATALFPLLALLVALAPYVVPLLYGDAWRPAIVPTQILAVGGMIAVVTAGVGPVALAAGAPNRLATLAWPLVAIYSVILWFTAPLGVEAVAIAAVGFAIVGLLVNYELILRPAIGVGVASLREDAGGALVASAAALAVAYPLAAGLDAAGAPDPVTVLVTGPVGVAVYALVLRRISRASWDDLEALVRGVLRRARPAGAAPAAAS
jgi:O-antigen/teichoic acid export membrane protein